MGALWWGGHASSMAISAPQVQHSMRPHGEAVTVPYDPSSPRPSSPPGPELSQPISATAHTVPVPSGASAEAERVQWPEPPQDAVLRDAPYPPVAPAPAAVPPRWSGRRTAAIAALALALTSAGALAAAAATPNGISGRTEQRGGAGLGGPGNRQLGPGSGGQRVHRVQPGGGQQAQPPGMAVPGQGRDNY